MLERETHTFCYGNSAVLSLCFMLCKYSCLQVCNIFITVLANANEIHDNIVYWYIEYTTTACPLSITCLLRHCSMEVINISSSLEVIQYVTAAC